MRKRRLDLLLAPWVFTIGFFVLWEAVCRLFNISTFVLPAPSVIAQSMWQYRTQLRYQ